MATRCIALLGPGLDGQLAIALLQQQGIEVVAATLSSVFIKYLAAVEAAAARLQVPLVVLPTGEDYLQRVRHPRFGYTREMAPCLDCKVYMLRAAAELLTQHDAQFLVTGDVVGQRLPGQSKRDLALVDFHAQQEGRVLRPLSARLLPETEVEQAGVVDRGQLLALQGRARQAQLTLAKQWGWQELPAVTSGCLLADATYAARLRTLLIEQPVASEDDFILLRFGKRLSLREHLTLVLGRNQDENLTLAGLANSGTTLFQPQSFVGPVGLVTQPLTSDDIMSAMKLIWQHRKRQSEEAATARFVVNQDGREELHQINVD